MASSIFKNIFDSDAGSTLKRPSCDVGLPPTMSSRKRHKPMSPSPDIGDSQVGALHHHNDSGVVNHQLPSHEGNDIRISEHWITPALHAPKYSSGKLEVDMQSHKSSTTASPSSTPSPLFSQISSSTIISSLCCGPEDMEIPAGALTETSLVLPLSMETAHPSTELSLGVEASKHLKPTDSRSTSPATQSPACDRLKSNTTTADTVFIAGVESEEAGQPVLLDPILEPFPLTKTALKRQLKNFVDLSKDIQRTIFEHVLVQEDCRPCYRRGMVADGPFAGCLDGEWDADIVKVENVDLSLLQVNKKFNKMCSKIFYGNNHFVFYQAEVFRWWIQHIGCKNFPRLRSLVLSLSSGFFHAAEDRHSPFELSQEEMWLSALYWMKNRHRLEFLHVHIESWQDLEWDSCLNHKEKEDLYQHRHAISSLLQRFGKIYQVKITSNRSRWFTWREKAQLALLMQQHSEPALAKAKEPDLLTLINTLRLQREEEEREEQRERSHQWPQYG